MAKEAIAAFQPLQIVYGEKAVCEAVNQATTKLAEKNKPFNINSIIRDSVKLLTGGPKRKTYTSSNQIKKDEFYTKRNGEI